MFQRPKKGEQIRITTKYGKKKVLKTPKSNQQLLGRAEGSVYEISAFNIYF